MRGTFRDPELAARLDRDGYAVIDWLDADEVASLRARLEPVESGRVGATFSASVLSHDLAYREQVDREIRAVMAPKVDRWFEGLRFCFANTVVKPANAPMSLMPLHQDWTFVDEERFRTVGIWCPLIDVDVHNGCVHVVPGSHLLNRKPRGSLGRFPYPELLATIRERCLKPVPLKAGQAKVFDQRLFHASPPNLSGTLRVAAAGLLASRDARLRFYHQELAAPETLEVFEVDDAFFLRHRIGERPQGVPRIAEVPYEHEPLNESRLLNGA